jgi:hypothetical protein
MTVHAGKVIKSITVEHVGQGFLKPGNPLENNIHQD